MTLRVVDLFSGIGGFSLGLESTGGFETVTFCEIDSFCRSVLRKYWPDVPCFSDIRNLKRSDIDGTVDVICGGFPCQPFSVAGKQRGKDDDRDLWPEMFRVIKEFKPRWVIGENVAGFTSMELPRTISDLESIGYEVQAFVIPACGIGAPHKRDRVWVVSYAGHSAERELQQGDFDKKDQGKETFAVAESDKNDRAWSSPNTYCERKLQQKRNFEDVRKRYSVGGEWDGDWDEVVRCLCRVDDGISKELDRSKRIKALGNAVVPQVVAEIGYAILKATANEKI